MFFALNLSYIFDDFIKTFLIFIKIILKMYSNFKNVFKIWSFFKILVGGKKFVICQYIFSN